MGSSGKSVLIIGGGTFGTSTTYHLSLNPSQYSKITVLDRFPVPSCEAAGNDINKVIRADYPEAHYARLMTEVIPLWSDPKGMFKGLYNRCGWFYGTSGDAADFVRAATETAKQLGLEVPQPMTPQEIRDKFPVFTGQMDGWNSMVWNSSAGWANARQALTRMAEAAMANGATYVTGEQGFVKEILFDESGRCIGAKSADGSENLADVVVLAAGAAAAQILDMKGQLVAKGHAVGHLRLSPEERGKYGVIPMMSHLEGGKWLVFPPEEDGIMKISAMHFLTNYNGSDTSLPRYRSDNQSDGIPAVLEAQLRKYMTTFLPELADRESFETRLCWDADMADYKFLIDEHPEHPGLQLAVGGSAYGFKFMPIIGKYIAANMEGNLDALLKSKWRWRPGAKLEGANPHATPLIELSNQPGWEKASD